jgi:hypothetical protein
LAEFAANLRLPCLFRTEIGLHQAFFFLPLQLFRVLIFQNFECTAVAVKTEQLTTASVFM